MFTLILQDTKRAFKSYSPVNIEENSSSYKNINPYATTQCNQVFKSSSADEVALASDIATSNSKCETYRSENRLHDQKVSHLKLHPSGHEHEVSAIRLLLCGCYKNYYDLTSL